MSNIDTTKLEEGDIIFSSVPNFLYRRIAKDTESTTSHVGIVMKDKDGKWVVAESKVPLSRYSTLENFVGRSEGSQVAVKRVKGGLTKEQIEKIRESCDRRMGILYHTGFNYDSERLFCSKFVHDVFLEATGIEIGEKETLRELFGAGKSIPLWFWKLWFFCFIPWGRRTVTPASQMRDGKLVDVCGGIPA